MSTGLCWLFLILSVFMGAGGISVMKAGQDAWAVTGILVMYAAVGLAYYFRSKAVVKIPVAVAYAVYEAGGLALVAAAGIFAFGEPLSAVRIMGMLMLLVGAWLLHRGTDAGREV